MKDDGTRDYALGRSTTCLSVQYRAAPDQPWKIWTGQPGPQGLPYGYRSDVAPGAVGSRENMVATVADDVINAKRRFHTSQFRAVERPGDLVDQWTGIPADEVARCVRAARNHWGETGAAKAAETVSLAYAAAEME